MGTRSLTTFKDEYGNTFCVLYRQYDGYPSGHGEDLKSILFGAKIVNGYTMNDKYNPKCFNGMGDLALRTILQLKVNSVQDELDSHNELFEKGIYKEKIEDDVLDLIGPGDFCLCPPDGRDCGQEYEYTIYLKDNKVYMTIDDDESCCLYDGPIDDFNGDECERE